MSEGSEQKNLFVKGFFFPLLFFFPFTIPFHSMNSQKGVYLKKKEIVILSLFNNCADYGALKNTTPFPPFLLEKIGGNTL